MSRIVRSAIALLIAAPTGAFAQGRFEGTITAKMNAGPNGAELTYLIKGEQFRMDMAGRGMAMYMLHDASKGSSVMVMPAQRMYMDMGAMAAEQLAQKKMPEMKATGKKETIAGYECEHMQVTSDNETWDVCVTKGIGSFAMTNPMGRGSQASQAWQHLGRDLFPLKVQRPGGDVSFEVTKIEKKSLDNSLFTIPDGFTKMDMGGMGRMGKPPV